MRNNHLYFLESVLDTLIDGKTILPFITMLFLSRLFGFLNFITPRGLRGTNIAETEFFFLLIRFVLAKLPFCISLSNF